MYRNWVVVKNGVCIWWRFWWKILIFWFLMSRRMIWILWRWMCWRIFWKIIKVALWLWRMTVILWINWWIICSFLRVMARLRIITAIILSTASNENWMNAPRKVRKKWINKPQILFKIREILIKRCFKIWKRILQSWKNGRKNWLISLMTRKLNLKILQNFLKN